MGDTSFAKLRQAVTDGDPAAAETAAREALAAGIPPLRLIDEAAMPALREVGEGFSNGDLFLPDLMLAARAMQAAMRVIEPALGAAGEQRTSAGRVVLGTVAGDIHEIGKNLVATLLSANGFEVHDLGVDVSAGAFAAKAGEVNADLVGVSALLTTTMTGQRAVVEALGAAGLRPRVKVMVGGAPVTTAWAEEIGADGYAEDAIAAVETARRLVGAPARPGVA
jgi:corrinoid protein of di/trimethylamine methyltransferase